MNQNKKGKRIERELVHFLKDHGFASARRTEQYCGKAGTADIDCKELSDFHIESKGVKEPSFKKSQLKKWSEQLEADCPEGKIPILFCKINGEDWLTLIPSEIMLNYFTDFIFITATGDSVLPYKLIKEQQNRDYLLNHFKVESSKPFIPVVAFRCDEKRAFAIVESTNFMKVIQTYKEVKKKMIEDYVELN